MADQKRSELLCSFYHESLRTWIKTIVNKFAISNYTALILGVHALRSYLNPVCEYELHSLPSKKVSGAKDHGKNYIKVRLPLVSHLLHNRLSYSKQWNYTANRYFRCGSNLWRKFQKLHRNLNEESEDLIVLSSIKTNLEGNSGREKV